MSSVKILFSRTFAPRSATLYLCSRGATSFHFNHTIGINQSLETHRLNKHINIYQQIRSESTRSDKDAQQRDKIDIQPPETFCVSPIIVENTEIVDEKVNKTAANEEVLIPVPTDTLGIIKYYLQGYASLSKVKLSALVLSTTVVGYVMAPGGFLLSSFILSTIGTGLTICSANSINQIYEIKNDSEMLRTKRRWLPTNRMSVTHASLFAAVSGVAGVGMLYAINPVAGSLALFNLFLYTSVYTPLKQKQPLNTWVGAIVGAIPPMIGWAAVTGGMETGSWVIGALLGIWQMPHFMALSYSLKDDYKRGGFRMLINTSPDKVPGVVLRYSLALLPIGYLSYACGMTSEWFALDSLIPTGYLTYLSIKFFYNPERQLARSIFKFSLILLPIMMILMIVHKKKVTNTTDNHTLSEEPTTTVAPHTS